MQIQWLHKASRLWCWLLSFFQLWLRTPVPTWVWSWFWTWFQSWLARWSGVLVSGAPQAAAFAMRAKNEEIEAARFVTLPQGQNFRKDSLKRRHSYGR